MIDYNLFLLQNPWWKNKELIDKDPQIIAFDEALIKYIPKKILSFSLLPGAINIITGPRQTGKSTAVKLLIRQLLEKKIAPEAVFYFNCDALNNKQEVIQLVINFLEINKKEGKIPSHYLFLDEISSVADWPYAIKWLADQGLLSKSKIILTGSSTINLKKSGEYLPGRRNKGKDIRFLPINFFEYFQLLYPQIKLSFLLDDYQQLVELKNTLIKKDVSLQKIYQDFLLTGGFLKMINVAAKKENPAETVELYRQSLKSEIFKAGKKEVNTRKVLEKIINSLTSETSYTNIAEESELGSKNTVIDYLSFFADSFLLKELFYFDISQKKLILKKNKKYYPTDPFFLWIFLSFINGSDNIELFYQKYQESPLDSQLAEIFIVSELYKKEVDFYFYKNSRELDFYLPKKEVGIEVKYKNKISSFDIEGLRPVKKKILVSKNSLEKRGDVLIIPACFFGFLKL